MVIKIEDSSVRELAVALEAGARDARKAADRRTLRSFLEHIQGAPSGVEGWAKVAPDAAEHVLPVVQGGEVLESEPLAPSSAAKGEALDLDGRILSEVEAGSTKTELVRAIGGLDDVTHAEVDARFDELKAAGVIEDGEARGKYVVDRSKLEKLSAND